MKYFNEIHGAHEGRPAIILCGGPSMIEQLDAALARTKDPVLISVNQHGCKHTKCDYSVSLDNIAKKMRECDTQKITPYAWADIKLNGHWNASNSGRTAGWVAWKLGCTPIIYVGVDMYQDRKAYWWDHRAHTSGVSVKLKQHVKEWMVLPNRVPPEILTAMGGPLVEHDVLPKFDARRKYPQVPYKTPTKVNRAAKDVAGQKVRLLRNVWAEGQKFTVGEEVIVRERTARQLVNIRKAEYVHA